MRDVRKESFSSIFNLDEKKADRMDKLINKREYDKEQKLNDDISKASLLLSKEKDKLLLYQMQLKEEQIQSLTNSHGVTENVKTRVQRELVWEKTSELAALIDQSNDFHELAGNVGGVISSLQIEDKSSVKKPRRPTKLVGLKCQDSISLRRKSEFMNGMVPLSPDNHPDFIKMDPQRHLIVKPNAKSTPKRKVSFMAGIMRADSIIAIPEEKDSPDRIQR